jgi:hypothetical protein
VDSRFWAPFTGLMVLLAVGNILWWSFHRREKRGAGREQPPGPK